jgi:hypothetical protein
MELSIPEPTNPYSISEPLLNHVVTNPPLHIPPNPGFFLPPTHPKERVSFVFECFSTDYRGLLGGGVGKITDSKMK